MSETAEYVCEYDELFRALVCGCMNITSCSNDVWVILLLLS